MHTLASDYLELNRMLLIACQRRQACYTEVSRSEQALGQVMAHGHEGYEMAAATMRLPKSPENGTLIISEPQLGLKSEFLLGLGTFARVFLNICIYYSFSFILFNFH